MKKWLLCIAILLVPLLVEASDSHLYYPLREIAENYADSYLTYRGALKAWYGNTLSRLGLKLDSNLEKYVQGRWVFKAAVSGYSAITKTDFLNLDLSPTEFKAIFNSEVKLQLGEKALSELELDIYKKYLSPGE